MSVRDTHNRVWGRQALPLAIMTPSSTQLCQAGCRLAEGTLPGMQSHTARRLYTDGHVSKSLKACVAHAPTV